MSYAQNTGQAPTLEYAAQRVEELLNQQLPIGVSITLDVNSPYRDADPAYGIDYRGDEKLVRVMVSNKTSTPQRGQTADSYPVRSRVGDDLEHIIRVNNLTIVPVSGRTFKQDILLPASEAFKLAFGYLNNEGVSDMTLEPVERIVCDALVAARTPSAAVEVEPVAPIR